MVLTRIQSKNELIFTLAHTYFDMEDWANFFSRLLHWNYDTGNLVGIPCVYYTHVLYILFLTYETKKREVSIFGLEYCRFGSKLSQGRIDVDSKCIENAISLLLPDDLHTHFFCLFQKKDCIFGKTIFVEVHKTGFDYTKVY